MLGAGLGQDSLLLYNNLLALPLMVVYMVVATSELQEIRYFPQLDDPLFLVRACCDPPDRGSWALTSVKKLRLFSHDGPEHVLTLLTLISL